MKYVVDFDTENNKSQLRAYTPSGVNVATYISKALSTALNKQVLIVSPSPTQAKKGCFRGKTYSLDTQVSVKLFPTFGARLFPIRMLRYLYHQTALFVYLLTSIKSNETIVVYHEMKFAIILHILKMIKKFRLILQVSEVYSDVGKSTFFSRWKEKKVINVADDYIFFSESLNTKLNTLEKPYIIIHGTYQIQETIAEKFADGRTHIVYSGTFDPRKGGAAAAVEAAKYLDDSFHIHILGFGSSTDTEAIIKQIEEVKTYAKCKLSYHGLLTGKKYIEFLQSCHIGLSTQNPDATFNDTSFPSKILSYMANGLNVVSVRIKVVETSTIGDLITYYDNQTPENIAVAIQKVDFKNAFDSRLRIKELDLKFQKEIKSLIEAVRENHQ